VLGSSVIMTLARLVRRVRSFLFAPPTIPLWRYCLLLFPLALIPSAALTSLVQWLLGLAGMKVAAVAATARSATVARAIAAVVVAPVAETFLLAGCLRILTALTASRGRAAAISALIWGCMHGLFGFLSFFGTVWSFFVFSSAYLNWRERSFARGYIAAAVPHALVNLTVTLVAFAHRR
jgi:membrane protease YdiL (CAAX protease family)